MAGFTRVAVAVMVAPLTGAVVLAVMEAVPPPVAVASPEALIVAIRVSLDSQVTEFVISAVKGAFE
jgi:hypothetical protein